MSSHVSGARRLPVLIALLTALLGSLLVGTLTARTADAATTLGQKATAVAAAQKGDPYRYGAVGPYRFDCSGLTKYAFSRVGKYLPHSSRSQYSTAYTTHVTKANKRVGDLIFMKNSSGTIYHVGVYAGSGKWWVAPHTGSYVKLQTIYSSNYVVGRVK